MLGVRPPLPPTSCSMAFFTCGRVLSWHRVSGVELWVSIVPEREVDVVS